MMLLKIKIFLENKQTKKPLRKIYLIAYLNTV